MAKPNAKLKITFVFEIFIVFLQMKLCEKFPYFIAENNKVNNLVKIIVEVSRKGRIFICVYLC